MKAVKKIYYYLRAIPKTLLFNFYYFPADQAIKFPVIVSHRVKFEKLDGKVILKGNIKTGKIRIGFGKVQIADPAKSRALWNLSRSGIITFHPRVKLGTGTKLDVRGNLEIGEGSNFTGEATIVCNHRISFGRNSLVSWQTLFMDTDLHSIVDRNSIQTNPDQPIKIGNDVWICAKSTILKGVTINNNTVVSANSNVTTGFTDGDIIIGGNPAKAISSMNDKKFIH
ncbi:acyltransferase [Photobacterium sp. OFAV2-7]|uniref:acyltransferase n=1 Tax=Photobacterium sp. OFAV2-7 TaxID=2917748 RepID=UPI001EF3FBA4|nr:acyltransferase [Photobacterium sp. OFAV2-7]MCG7584497.1 acyltransferase [Photobacterium sp. OFAV2-7]